MTLFHFATSQPNPCESRTDNQLVNDFSSCGTYFRCVGQQPIKESCKPNYIFSPQLQACTRCYNCPATGIATVPLPMSCTQYVLCVDGEVVSYRECPPGTQWNEVKQNCDLPEQADCQEVTEPPRGSTSPISSTTAGIPTAPTKFPPTSPPQARRWMP